MNDIERRTLIGAAGIGAIAALSKAGPLNPPAGPVTSTGKTTQELFDKVAATEPRIAINATNTPGTANSQFRITAPGSYYLTGNITGVVGKHGIEIGASGVTLDLNGFDLVGVPAMGAFDGVNVTAFGITSISVVNGSVRNWGDEGVDLGVAKGSRVEGVCANGNVGDGIATGEGSTISNCSASFNAGSGISAFVGSTVSDCSAYGNTGNGISTSACCTVTDCSAYGNTGNGLVIASGSTVTNCAARLNSLDGIAVNSNCTVRGNTCSFNGNVGNGAGIHATGGDNRIEGNNCTGADRGIDVDAAGNIIIRNTCSGAANNWDVVAGNVILVVNATTAAAVTGNAGGTAPGSTDPNANFTY